MGTIGNNNKSRAAKGKSRTGQGPNVAADRAAQLRGNTIAASRKQEKGYSASDKKNYSSPGTSKAKAVKAGTHKNYKSY
jgi:hypothetical protein